MYWFNHDHSGRNKLIDKINHLIKLLAYRRGLNMCTFVQTTGILDVMYISFIV